MAERIARFQGGLLNSAQGAVHSPKRQERERSFGEVSESLQSITAGHRVHDASDGRGAKRLALGQAVDKPGKVSRSGVVKAHTLVVTVVEPSLHICVDGPNGVRGVGPIHQGQRGLQIKAGRLLVDGLVRGMVCSVHWMRGGAARGSTSGSILGHARSMQKAA